MVVVIQCFERLWLSLYSSVGLVLEEFKREMSFVIKMASTLTNYVSVSFFAFIDCPLFLLYIICALGINWNCVSFVLAGFFYLAFFSFVGVPLCSVIYPLCTSIFLYGSLTIVMTFFFYYAFSSHYANGTAIFMFLVTSEVGGK